MKRVKLLMLCLTAGVLCPSLFAETLSNVSIEGVSSWQNYAWIYAPPEKMIDGSGFDEVVGLHDNDWNHMWQADDGSVAGTGINWIVFNLGSRVNLQQIKIWNFNRADDPGSSFTETKYGAKNIDIYVANDVDYLTARWTHLTNINLTEAPGTEFYVSPDVINVSGVQGRLVKIVINTNYMSELGMGGYWDQANCAGLSEVRFVGDRVFDPALSVAAAGFSTQSTAWGSRIAGNIFNKSGFDVLTGTHDNNSLNMWQSLSDDPYPWVIADLGGEKFIDALKVWNWNTTEPYAFTGIDIFATNDAIVGEANWQLVATSSLTIAPGTAGYNTPDLIDMEFVKARFLKLQATGGNWHADGSGGGLSEVVIYGRDVAYDLSDINKNLKVDLQDFAAFGLHWQECTDPVNVGCDVYWEWLQ